jgi:ESF2/ABP1 family protein
MNITQWHHHLVDAKRAYLRRKHTSTKKAHFTEGWVEFKDKKVARAVASMMNAQPIGGKKGTRWRDDVWTMKYLPRFKWDMLTEQIGTYSPKQCWIFVLTFIIAHEAAQRTARLRVELSQSRAEQREYLKNVELARVLDKRVKRKQDEAEKAGLDPSTVTLPVRPEKRQRKGGVEGGSEKKKGGRKQAPLHAPQGSRPDLEHVLDNIF